MEEALNHGRKFLMNHFAEIRKRSVDECSEARRLWIE